MSESNDTYERGLAAFLRGVGSIASTRELDHSGSDAFDEAWKLLLPLAGRGVAEAQKLVACMYDLGFGIEPSAREAERWYTLAADQGDAVAANNLCTLHQGGRLGDPPDKKAVRRWWKRATELGFNVRPRYPGDDAPI